MIDYMGTTISLGDTVIAGSYGYGTPKGTSHGTVVGFTKTKVKVQWSGYLYDATMPYYTARPNMIRVVNADKSITPTNASPKTTAEILERDPFFNDKTY